MHDFDCLEKGSRFEFFHDILLKHLSEVDSVLVAPVTPYCLILAQRMMSGGPQPLASFLKVNRNANNNVVFFKYTGHT